MEKKKKKRNRKKERGESTKEFKEGGAIHIYIERVRSGCIYSQAVFFFFGFDFVFAFGFAFDEEKLIFFWRMYELLFLTHTYTHSAALRPILI